MVCKFETIRRAQYKTMGRICLRRVLKASGKASSNFLPVLLKQLSAFEVQLLPRLLQDENWVCESLRYQYTSNTKTLACFINFIDFHKNITFAQVAFETFNGHDVLLKIILKILQCAKK